MWKQQIGKQRQRGNNAATEHRGESCMFVNDMWPACGVHGHSSVCRQISLKNLSNPMQRSCSNGLCRFPATTLGDASLVEGLVGLSLAFIANKCPAKSVFDCSAYPRDDQNVSLFVENQDSCIHDHKKNSSRFSCLDLSHVACWALEGI